MDVLRELDTAPPHSLAVNFSWWITAVLQHKKSLVAQIAFSPKTTIIEEMSVKLSTLQTENKVKYYFLNQWRFYVCKNVWSLEKGF